MWILELHTVSHIHPDIFNLTIIICKVTQGNMPLIFVFGNRQYMMACVSLFNSYKKSSLRCHNLVFFTFQSYQREAHLIRPSIHYCLKIIQNVRYFILSSRNAYLLLRPESGWYFLIEHSKDPSFRRFGICTS